MTINLINPNFRYQLLINFAKLFAILFVYRSSGMWDSIKDRAVQSIRPISSTVMCNSIPVVRTVAISAVLPMLIGYGVRQFEEITEYTGRDVFQGDIIHDLRKMSHYAFHTGIVSSMSWGIWKLSRPLADDFRVVSLMSSVYFYAVGRASVRDPAESFLMAHCKYLPMACAGLLACTRTPIIREHLPILASLATIGGSIHLISFH